MEKLISKREYERNIAKTRDKRMAWWREARFGMFVHYGLYSQLGRNEWAMSLENWTISEYEKLANNFNPKPGATRKWVELAKKAGMKYVVLTTRHHEGFSLWDSKVNPYNSVNYGCKRDIVKEFVEACREFDLKIGFYSSLMDWHHPDSWKCAYDPKARTRFNEYIKELNRELLTQYGKIDILWYDVPAPMESYEGWQSISLNQMVRKLQPEIIINNRSRLDEDFSTPEEHLTPTDHDWEACMTYNGISWGYVDSKQAKPYSYNTQDIIKMLNTVTSSGGNLLLNIGPMPDGSVPIEAVKPLENVGKWLKENGNAVYGKKEKDGIRFSRSNGVCATSLEGKKLYLWNWIWPQNGELTLGGFTTKVKNIKLLKGDKSILFEQKGHRIILKDLPEKSTDDIANIAVFELEFEEKPKFTACSYFPQLNGGENISGENNPNC